jgi:hypothetical protein
MKPPHRLGALLDSPKRKINWFHTKSEDMYVRFGNETHAVVCGAKSSTIP